MPDKPTADTHKLAPRNEATTIQSGQKTTELLRQPVRLYKRMGTWNVLLLALVIAVGFAVYLSSREVSPHKSSPPAQLIIVQLNDIYRLDAVRSGKRGGLARVVTLLQQLKSQNPNAHVIVLHAGDFLSPSLESNLFHGRQMIDAMNFINEVAELFVVPGNHEFDYEDSEKEYLTDAISRSKFRWVVANLERNDLRLLPALKERVADHLVLPFGKVRLGIFGLTIDGAHRGSDRPYAPISGDYTQIAGAQIEQLESKGADLIVGLTHLNISDDRELAKLKQRHPRFRWIAGGHEHSLEHDPGWLGAAIVTKGDSNARTIWKVSVAKNGPIVDIREESIVIDDSIFADPAFTRDVEHFYRAKLRNERPYLDRVVAIQLDRCYDGTEEAVRERESDWGDFLTDTMRTAYKGIKADVAVLNGGSIRIDDTFCERITFENLERTFAYETPIVFVKLKGKDLKKYILEDSASSKRGDGRFLQVSGVSFRRDLSANAKDVVKDLQIESAKRLIPFDESKTYIVAVNKYIFDCGDGYKFREVVTNYIPAGPDLRALTYSALSSQKRKSQGNDKAQALSRIVDLPDYVRPPSLSKPKWQTLSATDQPCR